MIFHGTFTAPSLGFFELNYLIKTKEKRVGANRFERSTSRTPSECAIQAALRPEMMMEYFFKPRFYHSEDILSF